VCDIYTIMSQILGQIRFSQLCVSIIGTKRVILLWLQKQNGN